MLKNQINTGEVIIFLSYLTFVIIISYIGIRHVFDLLYPKSLEVGDIVELYAAAGEVPDMVGSGSKKASNHTQRI